jgi:hypothetical protein
MTSSFTQTFGGALVQPAVASFASYTISTDLTLTWPLEADTGSDVLAAQNNVVASATSLSVYFPDATLASTGSSALVYNAGSNSFTVKSSSGSTLVSIASGEAWYFYLTDNSTAAGSWQVVQFGVGTSSASASSLAGAGLQAVVTLLNQNLVTTSLAANYSPSSNDRASVLRNTGGVVIYTPASAVTLGNGWFVYVINSGSGILTWTPSGGEFIDGSATKILSPTESCVFFSDGSNFYSLGYGRSVVSTVTASIINVAGSGTQSLSSSQLSAQVQNFAGALTGARTIYYGTGPGFWDVYNGTSGAYTLTLAVNAGDPGVVVSAGSYLAVRSDGTNLTVASTTTTGTVTSVATTAGQLVGGTITTTGTLGLATTAVTPGTYGDATNIPLTITADAYGRATSITQGQLLYTQVTPMTSAQLATIVTDETGTGSLVFATGPTLSDPVVGTQTAGNNTTLAASTAFVTTAVSALSSIYAPLASPALTGVPTAPTAASSTNTTQIATCAFVQTAVAAVPTLGYHVFAAGYWNGASTTNAKNVSSVSHPGTGLYTVTFTTPNADANYIVLVTPYVSGANNRYFTIYDQQAGSFTISNGGDNVGAQDVTGFSFLVLLVGN